MRVFRSLCVLNRVKFAKEFSGGGKRARAAGASYRGSLDDACNAFMEKTIEFYNYLQS